MDKDQGYVLVAPSRHTVITLQLRCVPLQTRLLHGFERRWHQACEQLLQTGRLGLRPAHFHVDSAAASLSLM